MLELDRMMTSQQALAECHRCGLVVVSERELAGRVGSRQLASRMPGLPGTLELNEWRERVWLKVHPSREGSWAIDLARELVELPTP